MTEGRVGYCPPNWSDIKRYFSIRRGVAILWGIFVVGISQFWGLDEPGRNLYRRITMKDETRSYPPEKCVPAPAVVGQPLGMKDASDRELARLAKGLAHPARVRIVRILLRRQMCICGELVGQLPLAQSTVSQHLKVLREAGLVEATEDGPRVCYRLAPAALERVKQLLNEL